MKPRDYIQIVIVAVLAAIVVKLVVLDAVVVSSHSMEQTLLVGDLVLVNKLVNPRPEHSGAVSTSGFSMPRIPLAGNIDRGDVVVFRFPGNRDERNPADGVEYVKRCIAVGGDTVEIREGDLYINGRYTALREQHRRPLFPGSHTDERLFPKNANYNLDFYGPVIVPKSGDVVHLSEATLPLWEKLIRGEGHSVEQAAGGILLDGKQTETFTIAQNYVFVLGDNYYNSSDSRFWGFLPEHNVIGKAAFVYWSIDRLQPSRGINALFSSIRWNRVGNYIR